MRLAVHSLAMQMSLAQSLAGAHVDRHHALLFSTPIGSLASTCANALQGRATAKTRKLESIYVSHYFLLLCSSKGPETNLHITYCVVNLIPKSWSLIHTFRCHLGCYVQHGFPVLSLIVTACSALLFNHW